jgi:hypothetical protein
MSGARAQKGVGRVGRWPGEARHRRVHGGVSRREVRETKGADRWGPRARERGRVTVGQR